MCVSVCVCVGEGGGGGEGVYIQLVKGFTMQAFRRWGILSLVSGF